MIIQSPSIRLFEVVEGEEVAQVDLSLHHVYQSNSIREMVVGVKSIVKKIEDNPNLRVHAEWIKRLERPYVFPQIKTKTVRYVELEK